MSWIFPSPRALHALTSKLSRLASEREQTPFPTLVSLAAHRARLTPKERLRTSWGRLRVQWRQTCYFVGSQSKLMIEKDDFSSRANAWLRVSQKSNVIGKRVNNLIPRVSLLSVPESALGEREPGNEVDAKTGKIRRGEFRNRSARRCEARPWKSISLPAISAKAIFPRIRVSSLFHALHPKLQISLCVVRERL